MIVEWLVSLKKEATCNSIHNITLHVGNAWLPSESNLILLQVLTYIMVKRPLVFETSPTKSKQRKSAETTLSPSNIQSTMSDATIYAIVASLSPI